MARPEAYGLPNAEKRDPIIKVIDIFGNDTMTWLPVSVG
jgi:hypothetical protein